MSIELKAVHYAAPRKDRAKYLCFITSAKSEFLFLLHCTNIY